MKQIHTIPEPPAHLQARAAAKWRELCGLKMQMESGLRLQDLALIEFAAISYDKAMEAMGELDKYGTINLNSDTQKLEANPAAAIFSRFHTDFVKRLIDLGLARVKPMVEPAIESEASEPEEAQPAEPKEIPVPSGVQPKDLLRRLKVVG